MGDGAHDHDFFQLVERSSDLIVIVREGKFEYVNPAFASALGYTQKELIGSNAASHAHPDERESVRTNIALTIEGATRAGGRRRLQHRDGSAVIIESSTFSTEFGGGPAAVLIGRNLSSEIRVQEEAQRRSEELRELFQAAPGAVMVWAMDGTLRFANEVTVKTLGFSSFDQMAGIHVADLFDASEREERAAFAFDQAARGQVVTPREIRLLAADGTPRVAMVGSCSIVYEGEPARLSIGFDMTGYRATERRAQAVFDSSPLAIAVTDEQLRVIQWNRRMQALMGWPDPASGEPAEFREEALPEARALADRARAAGQAEQQIIIGPRGDRADVPVWAVAAPLRLDPRDPPSGFVFMMLDLSEQERAREQLRAIFDASPQAIIALDTQGEVTLWSGAAEWMLGRTAEEATGKPAVFLDAADGAVRAAMHRALMGEPLSVEARMAVNGNLRDLSISFAPLHTGLGRPAGCVALVADVTERRQLERQAAAVNAALGRAEAEWRETFDAVDAAVMVVDPDSGVLLRMNRAATQLAPAAAGVSLHELVAAEPWRTIARELPMLRKTRSARLDNAEQGGRTWLVSLSPAKAWPGAGEPVIVLARDVSEFVALQDSLRKSEAMSSMGSLVAGVAHEVRNPLFAISATVDAMQSRLGSTPASEPFLDALRRELERLNTLMRDLLEYGKPTSSRLVQEPLGPVISAALRACESVAQKAKVKLENATNGLGEVPMDSGRLTQVFQNLIDNAVRHSPAGSVVRVEAGPSQLGSREAVEVRVVDQGSGFDPADLPRIFEPFFTRRRGGTGLGLSIVQRIVDQHGGTVEPRNRSQGGAIVSVKLPR